MHRAWHASCESPGATPATPFSLRRLAAETALHGVQAQAPCPGGTGTICNFVSEENDIHLEFGDGLARWAFLKGHFTNKH